MNPKTNTLASVEREVRGEIMKTDVFVKILGPREREDQLHRDLEEVFQRFRDFEQRFSRFRPESELTRFNQSSGGQITPELFALLETCQRYHQETDGIFDPTVLPTLDRLGYRGVVLPDADEGAGLAGLILDQTTLTVHKPEGLAIDLGGIGKGAIIDQSAAWLRAQGYTDFVIDAGGDIYAAGANHTAGYPYWAFDIEHPVKREDSVATVLLSDEAIATSGRNRRAWVQDGKSHHHLIDPRQQASASKELLTVSVIAPSATAADVWAKTCFILGEPKALSLMEAKGLGILLVATDGHTTTSTEWREKAWKEVVTR